MGEKKIVTTKKNCGNGIAEIEEKKIVAIDLWQWQWQWPQIFFFFFLLFQQFHCHNFFGCHKICFFSHFQQLGRHNSYSLSSTPPSIAPRVAWGNKNFGNLITEIQFFLPPPSHHLSSLSLILFLAISATVLPKFTLFPHFPK